MKIVIWFYDILKDLLELSIDLQNIYRRILGLVLINISPSNYFQKMLLQERYAQNSQDLCDTVLHGLTVPLCLLLRLATVSAAPGREVWGKSGIPPFAATSADCSLTNPASTSQSALITRKRAL